MVYLFKNHKRLVATRNPVRTVQMSSVDSFMQHKIHRISLTNSNKPTVYNDIQEIVLISIEIYFRLVEGTRESQYMMSYKTST